MPLRIRLALFASLVTLAAAATTAVVFALLPPGTAFGPGSSLPPPAPDRATLEPTALPSREDLIRLGIAAALAAAVVAGPAQGGGGRVGREKKDPHT